VSKARYTEPAVPEGSSPFTNCSIEISALPLDVFLRVNDGRKFKIKCQQRWALLQKLARYANSDGTKCYPSRKTLEQATGFSAATLDAYLKDLESDELQFVVKGGYAWEDGPRVRRLLLPIAGTQDSPFDKSRSSGFAEQELSIGETGVQDSKAGTRPRPSSTRQSLGPPVENAPSKTRQNENAGGMDASKSLAGSDEVLDWFEDELQTVSKITLSDDTRNKIKSQFGDASRIVLRAAFRNLLNRDKGWEGLNNSAAIIVKEFPSCLLAAERKNRYEEKQAAAVASALAAAEAQHKIEEAKLMQERAEREETSRRSQENSNAYFGGTSV
jgi:hypothetical protein